MKSHRTQKRKLIEITREKDECTAVSVKKPATGTVRAHQKATESTRSHHLEPQIRLQVPSAKIKLQLFPINEQTRLGLEKDGYNPFLELSLSAQKRISSVVRHLNAKWGSSSVAVGQLMLFPYNTNLEQLTSCRRWTSNDSAITAWEVYIDVGSSSSFRLRYGWYLNRHQEIYDARRKSSLLEAHRDSEGRRRGCSRALGMPNHQELMNVNAAMQSDVNVLKALNVPGDFVDDEVPTNAVQLHSTVPWDDNLTNLSIGGLLSEISLQGKINGSDPNSANKSGMQPLGLISDISIGDLLSEASLLGKISPSMKQGHESSMQPIFLSSSDISIGGLLSEASLLSNKNKLDAQKMQGGHAENQSPWSDNFTSLSIGCLLSEASLQAKAGGNPELKDSKSSLQPNAPLSDSFHSLFSAQMPRPSCHEPNLSILDAEETCHAFPIQKLQPNRDAANSNARASSSRFYEGTSSKQFQFPKFAQGFLLSSIKDKSFALFLWELLMWKKRLWPVVCQTSIRMSIGDYLIFCYRHCVPPELVETILAKVNMQVGRTSMKSNSIKRNNSSAPDETSGDHETRNWSG